MEAAEFLSLIARGDETAARAALERDPQLASARSAQGVSAICMAVYRQLGSFASTLAAQRGDLDLAEAACLGDRSRVAQLLAADPDALHDPSPDGFSALGYAAFFGHVELARDLIVHGADVRAASQNGMRVQPLHSAAAQGDAAKSLELARMLLQAGADPNASQQGGYTPLHEAALNGKLALMELLLAHGADPALANDKGETPIELARSKGQSAVVERLQG